jgi:hypothetical protein
LGIIFFVLLPPTRRKTLLTEGAWEFGRGGDLLIVVDFDGSKRLKDLEFFYVPMWIRVFDLPLGMMNSVTGKAMGNKWAKC